MTHACIANTACRASVVENNTRRPAFTEHPDVLCDGCHDSYRSVIGRLMRDYAMLRATLGERRRADGAPVHSTPSPVILIDSTSERLIADIVEWARFAADCVSEALGTALPDGDRKLPEIRLDGALSPPESGSLAERQHENSHAPEHQRLAAYLAIVEPHIDLLAAQPPQEIQIWAQPKRCDIHAEQVARAKRIRVLADETGIAREITDAIDQLQAAYAAAGACDDCCGWDPDPQRGQARQDAVISGLDVLLRLSRTHGLVRQHLGQTKLRHRYAMPCPNCGALVGRDDGASIVTCENDQCTAKGPSSWTDREYQLLAGLVGDEEREKLTTKWLLAEAYARLDGVAALVETLTGDTVIDQAGAGTIILTALRERMDGHADAEHRKIATDKDTTVLRQHDQDGWAWKREPRYEKPKRKQRKAEEIKPEDKITASSRSTITDTITPEPPRRGERYCDECELIHAGSC